MDTQKIFGQNKILNHLGAVKNWQDGKQETLITFELHMTNACNSRCPQCIGWHGEATRDKLNLEEAKSFIKQAKELGAKAVTFSGGGEPLLNNDTVGAIAWAYDIGLDVSLITNGISLQPNSLEMEILLRCCTWIRISLDAGTPGMYNKTHGLPVGVFLDVCKNIEALVTKKEDIKSDCTIGLGYLTGKETADFADLEDFVHLGHSLNVDYVQFRPYHHDFTDISKQVKDLRLKFDGSFSRTKIIASEQKYKRFNDGNLRPYKKCRGIHFTTAICADGKMYVCCHQNGNPKYCLGNLKATPMKDIWKFRHLVFDKVDFKDCPCLCRADEFNRLLSEIESPKTHINFL